MGFLQFEHFLKNAGFSISIEPLRSHRRPMKARSARLVALKLLVALGAGACASKGADDGGPYVEELEPGTLSLRVGITDPTMPLNLEPGDDEAFDPIVEYEQNTP